MKIEQVDGIALYTPESESDRAHLEQLRHQGRVDPGHEFRSPMTVKAGEGPGHPFRGNQYATGEGGGAAPPELAREPSAVAAALAKLRPEMRARFDKVYGIATGPDFATHDTKTNFFVDAQGRHFGDPNFDASTGHYTPERQQVHDQIISDILAASQDVPTDRQAIIMGGLGGSGKSSLLRAGADGTPYGDQRIVDENGNHVSASDLFGVNATGEGATREEGARITNYANVNSDDIKERLINAGLAPQIDGLQPMETAPLIHEESSDIAHEVGQRLIDQGTNIIYDVTLGSQSSGAEKISQLHDNRYNVSLAYVRTSVDSAVSSAIGRWSRGVDDYASGKGQGGRFVNPDIMQAARDGDKYTSKNEAAFYALIGDANPAVRPDNYFLIDNANYARRLVAKG